MLTTAQRTSYRQYRADGLPALLAYNSAVQSDPLGFEFTVMNEGLAVAQRGVFTITITEDWDIMGESAQELGTIVKPHEWIKGVEAPQGIRMTPQGHYFVPATTYWDHRRALKKIGYSRGVAAELAQQWIYEDFKDYTVHSQHIVRVSVTALNVELAQNSVGDVPLDESKIMESAVKFAVETGMVSSELAAAQSKLRRLRALDIDS